MSVPLELLTEVRVERGGRRLGLRGEAVVAYSPSGIGIGIGMGLGLSLGLGLGIGIGLGL